MRGEGVGSALEQTWRWEKGKISKIKRHSFKHINSVKLQYIMPDPPQPCCLLAICTEGAMRYHTPTHSGQGYMLQCSRLHTFQQFKHARLNSVHF